MENKELSSYCIESMLECGADQAQCSQVKSRKFEVNIDAGELSLIRTTYDQKLNLLAIRDGKKGSVGMNKFDTVSVKEAVKEVMDIAGSSEPDEANGIAEWQPAEEFCIGSSEPDRDLIYARLKEFMQDVKKSYPKINIRTSILDFTHQTGCLSNSNGVEYKSSKGIYHFMVMLSSREGEKSSSFNSTGFSARMLDKKLIDCGSVRTILEQTSGQVETSKISGKFIGDVIITPDCMRSFVSIFVDSFLRDGALISGTSLFKDQLGKQIADTRFNLHSRPLSNEIADAYFYTGDGYKVQDSTIINNGHLNGFMLGLYGARKTGKERAVNSGGCYIVDAGDKALEEIIKSTKKGLLLCRFSGGRPSRNGDFSGVAKNSYYIENGEIKYPVNETMVSGNLAGMFGSIIDISKETVNFGSAVMPWIAVSGLVISGK